LFALKAGNFDIFSRCSTFLELISRKKMEPASIEIGKMGFSIDADGSHARCGGRTALPVSSRPDNTAAPPREFIAAGDPAIS
jgi:hypothetical protein